MQPAAKSVMSRLGPLTPQQRQDMLALIAQGIDAATARAIVQGYAGVQKADAPERPGYHAAYVAQAKATLPDWQHKALHNAARASAGGHAAAVSRQAVDAHTAALAEIEALHLRIGQLQQEVDKSGMSASDVHVPVPLEGDKRLVIKDALACAYAEAALQLVAKADWEEAKHPRANNGEFGAGGGSGQSSAKPPPLPQRGGPGKPPPLPKAPDAAKPKKPRAAPVPFANADDVQYLGTQSHLGRAIEHGQASVKAHQDSLAAQREGTGHLDAALTAVRAKDKSAVAQHRAAAAEAFARAKDLKKQAKEHDKAFKGAMRDHDAAPEGELKGKSLKAGKTADHADFTSFTAKDHEAASHAHQALAEEAHRYGQHGARLEHMQSAASHMARAADMAVANHERKARAEDRARDRAKAEPAATTGARGGKRRAKQRVMHSAPQRLAKDDAQALAYAQAAYALQAPIAAYNPDAADVPPDAAEMMQANRLVAGMDTEMAAGAASPDEARRRASRALVERPGLYDGAGATPRTDRLVGLQLDLGSGTARAPGHIGLDLGTFGDYGNAIHDVNLGLGEFSDGSAKAVRLVNSLHDILGEDGDPVPLLVEVQRVLCEGGQLTYVGPEPLYEDEASWPCPGLLLVGEQGVAASAGEDGVGAVRQVFERVPPRVPAYHGADADYQPAGPVPIDVAMAMAAYNQAPARMAMANLVHKTANKVVRIAKAEPMKQVLVGVVLAPNEPDLQGDIMHPDDIEAAAHGYLGTSRVIGSEHGAPIEAHPVESYIAPQDLTFDGPQGRTHVAKGSWVLGVKVVSPDEWAKVMQDGYTGFSVGGFGLREDL